MELLGLFRSGKPWIEIQGQITGPSLPSLSFYVNCMIQNDFQQRVFFGGGLQQRIGVQDLPEGEGPGWKDGFCPLQRGQVFLQLRQLHLGFQDAAGQGLGALLKKLPGINALLQKIIQPGILAAQGVQPLPACGDLALGTLKLSRILLSQGPAAFRAKRAVSCLLYTSRCV